MGGQVEKQGQGLGPFSCMPVSLHSASVVVAGGKGEPSWLKLHRGEGSEESRVWEEGRVRGKRQKQTRWERQGEEGEGGRKGRK